MKTPHYPLLALFLLSLFTSNILAQQTPLIQSDAYGYAFKTPKDWIHQDLQNGNHLFGSNTVAGLIIILAHDFTNMEEVKAYAQSEGIAEEGLTLHAIEPIVNYSKNGISGTFKGWIEGESAKAAVICLFSPYGGGMSILTATSPEKFDKSYVDLANTIAKTVQFKRPVESTLVQQWKQKLNNKKLTYYNTTDDVAEKMTYVLYQDGWFVFGDESFYSSTDHYTDHSSTFSSLSTHENAGQWKIIGDKQQAQLQLSYNSGGVKTLSLQMKDGSNAQVLLNGKRFFMEGLD